MLYLLLWKEYPFDSAGFGTSKFKRSLPAERLLIATEATLWLRLGRVSFVVGHTDSGWSLEVDYNGCLLATIALQLALILADVDALYRCSGRQQHYVRAKKAPKLGEAKDRKS